MTLAISRPHASSVSWASPDRGLWIAANNGEHLGMIERRDGRYISTDAKGRTVGTFDDFTAAQIAIDHDNLGVDLDHRETVVSRVTIGLLLFSLAGIAYTFGVLLR
jgi:hypothetical protein